MALVSYLKREGRDEEFEEQDAKLHKMQMASVAIVEHVPGIKPSRETREVTHRTVMEAFIPESTDALRESANTAAKNTRRSLVHFQNDEGLIRVTRSQVYRRDGIDKDGNEILIAQIGEDFNNVARITPFQKKGEGKTKDGKPATTYEVEDPDLQDILDDDDEPEGEVIEVEGVEDDPDPDDEDDEDEDGGDDDDEDSDSQD